MNFHFCVVSRFEAGGDIEFDVFAKRDEEDDPSFLTVTSPTVGDVAVDRHVLLRQTVQPSGPGSSA